MLFTAPLRLSPSGPVIANDDGGTLVPGEGFMLRLAENTGGASIGFVDQTFATLPITTSLASPNANLKYRFAAEVDIASGATAAGSVNMKGQVSYDNVTWYDLPNAALQAVPIEGLTTMAMLLPSTKGDALPNWPAAGADNLYFRVQLSFTDATTADINPNGGAAEPIRVHLSEHL